MQMHIQIVTFQLRDMTEAEYRASCDEVAPAFAAVPGLLSKVWLADPATRSYGGVYTWRDRRSMEEFASTALFEAVRTDPHLVGLTSQDFAMLEEPTRVTRGVDAVAV